MKNFRTLLKFKNLNKFIHCQTDKNINLLDYYEREKEIFHSFCLCSIALALAAAYVSTMRANAVDIAQFDTCITSRDMFFLCATLSQ